VLAFLLQRRVESRSVLATASASPALSTGDDLRAGLPAATGGRLWVEAATHILRDLADRIEGLAAQLPETERPFPYRFRTGPQEDRQVID
jgi:hypothetical protein